MNDLSKLMGIDVDIPQMRLVPLDSLVGYHRNARTHSVDQLEQIGASLLKFGWTNAILADGMGVVAGHGRMMAAAELYRKGKQISFPNGAAIPIGYVPVIDCSGWNDAQRRAYILADNKLALNAGWDEDLLKVELEDLKAMDFDLDVIGFSEDELLHVLADEIVIPDRDPDDAPDAPETPASMEGDVWICGAHRVMCGSATAMEDWSTLMQGERADICWTDPPYNVDYVGKTSDALTIQNDKMDGAGFRAFLDDTFGCLLAAMKSGAPIYVAHADTEGANFRSSFIDAGFKLQSCLIWRKNSMVLGRSDYHWMHEPILYGWKPGSAHRWYGGRKLVSILEHGEGGPISQLEDGRWVIRVGDNVLVVSGEAQLEEQPGSMIFHTRPSRSSVHPTMKPVGLIEKMLTASARAGDIVIDGFGGSGSTLIAADRLGMCARLMELDPVYVDVIVTRWQQYTGRQALHAKTGEPFPCDPSIQRVPAKPQKGDGIF